MSLIVNNTAIKAVNLNNDNIKKIIFNNTEVWSSRSIIKNSPYASWIVVLNNEIYLLSSSKLYKYNGNSWNYLSEAPYPLSNCSVVVYNNEIHVLGGQLFTIPTTRDYRKYHYKWNGTSWVSVSTLPYEFTTGSAVVYGGKIHILGSGYNHGTSSSPNYLYGKQHCVWNGSSWTSLGSTLPYILFAGKALTFNNKIHILGSGYNFNSSYLYAKYHYQWNESSSSWTSVSTLPYDFYFGSAAVYNEKIHILGGPSPNKKAHYKYENNAWISQTDLPLEGGGSKALVHNLGSGDELLYFTNQEYESSNTYYVEQWDDTSWVLSEA